MTSANQDQARQLLRDLFHARIGRREFIGRAAGAGLSAGLIASALRAAPASAQDATPDATPLGTPGGTPGATPGGTGEVVKSITRDEYNTLLMSSFPFEAPANTGGQVIYGETSDIDTLNPILVSDVYSGRVSGFIYEFLVGTSVIDGTNAPGLADYWEIGADGITYTFYINADAAWTDGTPLTAEDVVFSFDATLAEGSLSPRRSSVDLVTDSYRAVDDKTFEIVSKEPNAVFLENSVGLVGIVPKHLWENVPFNEAWGTDGGSTGADPSRVIGSGPFLFQERVESSFVTLVRNDNYWDPTSIPVIDSFTFQVTPESSANVQALQTGQVDLAGIPFAQATQIKEANPQLSVVDYPTAAFNYYTCRVDDMERSPFFTEVPVRQAMMYALDRDLIASSVYQGYAERADGTQPTLSPAYAPERITTVYTYDPDMANQLLDDAGWVAGDDGVRAKDGVRFSFEMLFSEGAAVYEQQVPAMQQYWKDVGIEMLPAAVPFQTLSDAADAGDIQMCLWGFSWGFDGGQGDMFRTDAVRPAGFNTMHYSNARYDELDAAQQRELDPDARVELLIEQSNIVNDEQAAGIIVFRSEIVGSQTRLHNYFPNGYGYVWSIPYAWVDPAE